MHTSKIILLKKKIINILKVLKNLKKRKKINYYGYSVYSPNEIKLLISRSKPDYIQAPFSIIDQRMINSGILKFLKKKKIKFQARSIYLQGVLTDKKVILNNKFIKNRPIIKKWFIWLKKNSYKPESVLINFIKKYDKYLDSVIISSKKLSQIKSNYAFFRKKSKNKVFEIANISNKIVDPRKW